MDFYQIDGRYQNKPIFVDDQGRQFDLTDFKEVEQEIKDHIPPRSLVFLVADNACIPVAAYLSFLRNQIVPVMMSAGLSAGLTEALMQDYRPDFLLLRNEQRHRYQAAEVIVEWEKYCLLKMDFQYRHQLYPDLALLLTTSGSTGSPKLVRQSYGNINANAASIAEYLQLSEGERPITTLPFHYTYGISVINSHLLVGATILLTEKSVIEKDFWQFLKAEKATSIAGVPYTYTLLHRLRFFKMELPCLKTMTQAGGKLAVDLHRKFAEYARQTGKAFVVMYGQTEATARMAYLPADQALDKIGAMGIAIPGGRFELIDADGNIIKEPEQTGELVYYGENVTLGYAETAADLGRGDDRNGRLETGDMAKCDKDGYYTIVGRKKRFLKIFGNRVNLDEIEAKCLAVFPGHEFACTGQDDEMKIYYTGNMPSAKVSDFLYQLTGFHKSAVLVAPIDEIPKNEAGKIMYGALPS